MNGPAAKTRLWRAWCLYDWGNSAFATVILTAVFPVYFVSLIPPAGVHIPGLTSPLAASALWGYLVSGSLLLVALCAPQLGHWADRRGHHLILLRLSALGGAAACLLLALPVASAWLPAALFFALANLAFAGGNIFYNAYLPILAAPNEMDRLSSRGYALGYLGGGLALLLVFGLIEGSQLLGLPDKAAAGRLGFALTGLWWAAFALPALLRLPATPARPAAGRDSYLATFRELRRHDDLFRFLLAFLCYNDGVQTVIVVSAVFARQELGLSQGSILGCFLMIQFLALPGTLLCGRLAERFGPRRILLFAIGTFLGVVCWAWFMTRGWEFWALGVIVAAILGGIQALSRSLFGSLVPAGKNAEFFGFFAISNKFAAILGPFLFALINQLTGSTRNAIIALSVLFILGGWLLTRVDIERGRRLAREEGSDQEG
ncbi:MFS transporter [Geothermobacter hydrogeniphilus]|uniref:MFS transporter n=1 Tax=Geothermobacter hydrogeniphilus TaxID=1969733 RepID=A0A2K2H6E6_9BACT|nr:MFS transporter [Geothermobacter hydrogeniphilus]PNU18821.1 MFS transporter [Geothermobacter hydrogeniphilus]